MSLELKISGDFTYRNKRVLQKSLRAAKKALVSEESADLDHIAEAWSELFRCSGNTLSVDHVMQVPAGDWTAIESALDELAESALAGTMRMWIEGEDEALCFKAGGEETESDQLSDAWFGGKYKKFEALLSRENADKGLHFAAGGPKSNLVEICLSLGANPDGKNPDGGENTTPLYQVIRSLFHTPKLGVEQTRILIAAGANVNRNAFVEEDGSLGATLIHWAALNWDAAICELLLKAGADPNSIFDNETPLMWAASYGAAHFHTNAGKPAPDALERILALLIGAGAHLEHVGPEGKTATEIAKEKLPSHFYKVWEQTINQIK